MYLRWKVKSIAWNDFINSESKSDEENLILSPNYLENIKAFIVGLENGTFTFEIATSKLYRDIVER